MNKYIKFGFVLVVVLAVFSVLDQNRHKFYIFDPDVLHNVVKETVALNLTTAESFDRINNELARIYPGHIDTNREWIFNVAGGAMGQMDLLHCSITEYIMFFGTPIGSEGYSGRFLADDFFMIIEGEQHSYEPGDLDPKIYRPGDVNIMRRGLATGYKFPAKGFALEYARGWIPTMLPFGIWDTLFSTLDVVPFYQTFAIYAKLTIKELLQGKF